MVNPRQRRKQKSGTYSAAKSTNRKKLRKTPTIMGPKAIREAWDKKKSLHQNYSAMGLAIGQAPVNTDATLARRSIASEGGPLQPKSTGKGKQKATEYGRIIRDHDGKVLRIEEDTSENDQGHAPNRAAPRLPGELAFEGEGDQRRDVSAGDHVSEPNDVIRALEDRSVENWEKSYRPQSANELMWLVALVKAHGDDVAAMHMDRKRNTWQRTPGELKKAIRLAGGKERLLSLWLPTRD